uniref:helicase-like transcription factor isoform X2 n=1 Tax=Panthera onca TaxID=9690 RepID=UPI00295428F4|nr:helicase-like transcription factor isoform X2 [Panthera onca]
MKLGGNTSEKADGLIKGSRCSGEPSISDVKGKNKYPKSELSSSRPKRRKTVVQYIESSDSEEIETNELPQKMKGKLKNSQSETKRVKGSSKVKEDAEFACALISSTPATKRRMLKKGASAVESSKKTDVEERPRTTLIICPLSVLSNWIVSLHSLLKCDIICILVFILKSILLKSFIRRNMFGQHSMSKSK